MTSNGPPPGYGTYPTQLNYFEYELLSDNNVRFMSSFIPQFCYFLSRGFQENKYYRNKMLPDWLNADYKYWHSCDLMDPTKFCPFFTTSFDLMDPKI